MHAHHHLDASGPASVVLDIGAGTGALVLYTPPDEHGREIEISRVGEDRRVHAAVRERQVDGGSVFCVVYPGLAAGDYAVWDGPDTLAGTVTVTGATVTETDWDALTGA
jgi:hypothetical protein